MRTRRLALLCACMLVGAMLMPGTASATHSGVEDSELKLSSSCTSKAAAIDSGVLDAASDVIDFDSDLEAFRFRCVLTPVDDPRTGASYTLSVFLGVACPSDQADEFCFFKSGPHVIDRVGAEVAEQDNLVYYDPGSTVPVPVCIQFVLCEQVDVPLTFTVRLFDAGAQGEIEVFVIGDPTGVNPPELCTGVGAECDSSLENSDFSRWVY